MPIFFHIATVTSQRDGNKEHSRRRGSPRPRRRPVLAPDGRRSVDTPLRDFSTDKPRKIWNKK